MVLVVSRIYLPLSKSTDKGVATLLAASLDSSRVLRVLRCWAYGSEVGRSFPLKE